MTPSWCISFLKAREQKRSVQELLFLSAEGLLNGAEQSQQHKLTVLSPFQRVSSALWSYSRRPTLQLYSRSPLLQTHAQAQSITKYFNGYIQLRGRRPIPASGGQHQYNQCFCCTENLLGERVEVMFICGKGIKKKLKANLEHLISFRLNWISNENM